MKKISVIIPCWNEEEALPIYYNKMCEMMEQMTEVKFELLFVDDGSTDDTLIFLRGLNKKDPRCRFFSFSRNFGKEAAIYAGLKNVQGGDFVAIMDVDMQDPPELLPEMYYILQSEGYDCVGAKRSNRVGEPRIRSYLSEKFYKVINRISKIEIVRGARDYRVFNMKVMNAVIEMGEYNRFSKGLFEWVGFRTKWLEYDNVERSAGDTKWTIWKLFLYSLEGITSFSAVPLSFAAVTGLLFCVVSFFMVLFIVVRTLIWGDPVSGWPSLVCIIFLVGGIQLFCTGILGHYLSKIYMETKHRPIFIMKESSDEL
ncbi:MAG: glycosyltransferase family 2 protein [Ruminococcus sp.]|nr:glycosyltransferase family 2 protein [Ruminococcus sp.]